MTGVNYSPASYAGRVFPPWAEGIGWIMVVIPIVLIIVGAIVQLIRSGGSVSIFSHKGHLILSSSCSKMPLSRLLSGLPKYALISEIVLFVESIS